MAPSGPIQTRYIPCGWQFWVHQDSPARSGTIKKPLNPLAFLCGPINWTGPIMSNDLHPIRLDDVHRHSSHRFFLALSWLNQIFFLCKKKKQYPWNIINPQYSMSRRYKYIYFLKKNSDVDNCIFSPHYDLLNCGAVATQKTKKAYHFQAIILGKLRSGGLLWGSSRMWNLIPHQFQVTCQWLIPLNQINLPGRTYGSACAYTHIVVELYYHSLIWYYLIVFYLKYYLI